MYKIEKNSAGYIITFSGIVKAKELQRWYNELNLKLASETSDSFGVIIDTKELKTLDTDSSIIIKNGQQLYKEKGMKRSAVILKSQQIYGQFKAIASLSGIMMNEKYIDASNESNPIKKAIQWVNEGLD